MSTDERIAELAQRIHEASRVRPALSWGAGFGSLALTLEPLETVVGDGLMLLGGLAAAIAAGCIVHVAISRMIAHWSAEQNELVAERGMPRAELITRK